MKFINLNKQGITENHNMKFIFALIVILLLIVACETTMESENNAPADHTINEDGIMHKPGLNKPDENCTSCHGENLQGTDKAPSCHSCHDKKW